MAFSESFEIGNSTLQIIEEDADFMNEGILEIVNKSPTSKVNKVKRRKPGRTNLSKKDIDKKTILIVDSESYSDFFKSNISFQENVDQNNGEIVSQKERLCNIASQNEERCSTNESLKTNVEKTSPIKQNMDVEDLDIFLDSFENNIDKEVIDLSVLVDESPDCEILHSTQNPSFVFVKTKSEESIKMLNKELENGKNDLSIMDGENEQQIFMNLTSKFENLSTSEKPLLQMSISSESSEDDNPIAKEGNNKYEIVKENDVVSKLQTSTNIVLESKKLHILQESPLFDNSKKEVQKLSLDKTTNENSKLKDISSWNLPATILEEYSRKGIKTLFDWQVECLNNPKILFENGNLVYSAPTSAGKTLVCEIIAIKNIVERNKKVIFILPFVSVVREKTFYLQDLLCSSGYRVEGFFGGYSPPGGFDSINLAVCTIEKANSIVNRLLELGKLASIGCIIIDEIHLISDPGRGYILELLLAKILYMSMKLNITIQIVTMSATLPNCEILKDWLNAELYVTNFRPVELREMIKVDTKIYDNKLELIRVIDHASLSIPEIPNDQDGIAFLCLETLLEGCSVIIFCPSKDWCENLSKNLSKTIKEIYNSNTELGLNLQKVIVKNNLVKVNEQLKSLHYGCDKFLEMTCEYGCAFHHAGLTTEERDVVETNFKNGFLKIIVATSTLSSGVNLPARRVIIRSPLFAGKLMDRLTYKQMIGRAGRTGKDTLGESILICNENNFKFGKELLQPHLRPISSCLGYDSGLHLKRAILEVISSGTAKTPSDLQAFLNCMLFNVTKQEESLDGDCGKAKQNFDYLQDSIQFLTEFEFIRTQNESGTENIYFVPSRLGMACLVSSLPPTDGIILFSELQRSRKCFVLESELHAVYLVTPYSVCYQLQSIDWLHYLDIWEQLPQGMKKVAEIVGVKESFLVRAMRNQNKLDLKLLQIHKRFYIALALQELVNEVPIGCVANKYKCNRGLLQSLQQMSSTFASIVTSFCNALNWKILGLIVSQFKERLYFGVHRDLIDLMKLPDLNGHKARALFNAGIETLIDLANSNSLVIEKILHDCLSFESSKRQDGENENEAQKRIYERKVFVTGKTNLTIKDAAELLIKSARKFLQYEIGVACNWDNIGNFDGSTNKEIIKVNKNFENEIENDISEAISENLSPKCMNSDLKNKPGTRNLKENENMLQILSTTLVSPKNLIRENILPQVKSRNLGLIDISKSLTQKNVVNKSSDEISDISNVSIIRDPNLLNNLQNGEVKEHAKYKEVISIIDLPHDVNSQKDYLQKIFESKKIGFSIGIEKLPTRKNDNVIIGANILINNTEKHAAEVKEIFTIEGKYFISGISISYENCSALFINFQNEKNVNSDKFQSKLNFLKELICREDITLRIYDSKEHIKILYKYILKDFKSFNIIEDPKIANWLLDPDGDTSIHKLISEYLPQYLPFLEDTVNYKGYLSLGLNYNLKISGKERSSYEASFTRSILEVQLKNLQTFADGQMMKFFYELEMPIQRVLACSEVIGFSINFSRIQQLTNQLFSTMKNLENKIYLLHGSRFNLGSSLTVAKVLGLHKKINGKCSTSKQILEKMDSPLSNLILNYRKVSTILTKNIQPLQRVIQNNRIYGSSITTSSTGRISMREPNVQNIAKDFEITLDDKIIKISCRSVFLCQPGRVLLSADFCQLEMRILAHLCQDECLKSAINSGQDIFTIIAAKWNSVEEKTISDQLRNGTKQICYGIVYGLGIKALSENLKCTEEEASTMLEQFHTTFPGIRAYINKVIKFARQCGYIETITGRRRYLKNINSNENMLKSQAERQSINSTIQGSAADIAKSAMLRMEKNIIKYKSKLGVNLSDNVQSHVDLVLHLHDELIYEVPEEKVRNVAKVLKATMENCVKLSVPLKVKIKAGPSWGEMSDLNF
ncbi:DNA polymerase theta isoform X2 [Condylostylus longicornis]|uniref:DNA polymerase theta isoform X2 n=1 Tax=Condylostylus longicornis TaxID=2530218 RepID=UPI00244E0CB7|nr:DNA polymerase theta isoform X2 [Condylostylus longicornis]